MMLTFLFRNASRLSVVMLCFCMTRALAGDVELASLTTPPGFPDQQRVGELIAALGNPRYVARREAEQKLLDIGLVAFDQIDAATSNSDPEISASCRYLLTKLTIRWTRRDDPPKVKRLLQGYSDLHQQRRREVAQLLGALPDQQGLSALCRICRYDASPVVSRQAAVELLSTGELDLGLRSDAAPRLRQAIGASTRSAAHWIRLLALQLESPKESIAPWIEAIERTRTENRLAAEEEMWTAQSTALLTNLVRLELLHGDQESFLRAVARLLEHSANPLEHVVEGLTDWAFEAEKVGSVDALLDTYETGLTNSKGGLYVAAMARARQEKLELAEKLADAAFQIEPRKPSTSPIDESLLQAQRLLTKGYVEWARRELRKITENGVQLSDTHAIACYMLADSLHDWQRDEEAAQVLARLTGPLKKSASARNAFKQRYQSRGGFEQMSRVPDYNTLLSQEHFYLACHHLSEKNTEEHWKSLEQAIKYDSENVDILIAMYRASEDDPARRKPVMTRIEKQRHAIEQQIDEHPDYYVAYNHWAWLVSNTEGDFDKAVRYSHYSLELNPDSAGLLDTLGCCYFAAGDVTNAVKYQRQAVELAPHLRVLQRQLDRFEKALAEQ